MRSAGDGVAALVAELQTHDGTLAEVLSGAETASAADRPGPAQIAAAGPRASGHEHDYELLLEMILEGALLHYGTPRVVATEDPDLALLLGDRLYALGLLRLAALGDLAAVAELADVISLIAQASAAGDERLIEAVWRAGAVAIGWGASAEHEAAKAAARAEDPGAAERLLDVAESRRASPPPS